MLLNPLNLTNFNTVNRLFNVNSKSNCKISFKQLEKDSFERTPISRDRQAELLRILEWNPLKVNKKFLDGLTTEEYNFCLNFANTTEKVFKFGQLYSGKSVMDEDITETLKYAEICYKGVEKIAKKHKKDLKDVLVVSIGQSPTAIVQTLGLKGLNIAFCPISCMSNCRTPVEQLVTKETVEKGFKYWDFFGFNLEELAKDKLIIFTDYSATDASLNLFKKIIKRIPQVAKIKQKATTEVISLQKLFGKGSETLEDEIFAENFEHSVFHTSYLKTLYSPLFKAPVEKFSDFATIFETKGNSIANKRFTKLTILLYNGLKTPQEKIKPRGQEYIDGEREYRLTPYTPLTLSEIDIESI